MNRRTVLPWLLALPVAVCAATTASGPPSRHDRTAAGFRSMIEDLRAANDVKDPVLRKRFEEEIEKNHRLDMAYRTKSDFEYLEGHVEADTARYLTDAYSRPPFRTHELEALLAHNNAIVSANVFADCLRVRGSHEGNGRANRPSSEANAAGYRV